MQKISVAKIDIFLFNLINGYAKKSRLLDFLGIFCAKYLGFVLIAWLLIIAYLTKSVGFFLIPMTSGLLSILLVNEVIYMLYKRKRPMEVMPENKLISKPASPAFPSSHTSFFFSLSLAVFLFSIPLAVIFIVMSCLIALARIFCGVHWPSDIAGGICSAIASFFIIYLMTVA